jgi:hypothetical protein
MPERNKSTSPDAWQATGDDFEQMMQGSFGAMAVN